MKYIAGLFAAVLALAGCGKENPKAESAAVASSVEQSAAQPSDPASAKKPESQVDKGPWDGPFGLKMGLTIEQITAAIPDLKAATPHIYSTSEPPKPHDSFGNYLLLTSATTGLCKITAVGKIIQTSQFGDELRYAYKNMKAALAERYGKPTSDYDFLKNGSIWNESKYWMMGLVKKDRVVATYWEKNTGTHAKGADLPNDLASISMEASADGTNDGHVTLRYEFSNEEACVDALKKEKNKAL